MRAYVFVNTWISPRRLHRQYMQHNIHTYFKITCHRHTYTNNLFLYFADDLFVSVYPPDVTSSIVDYGDSFNISFIYVSDFRRGDVQFELLLNGTVIATSLPVDPVNDQIYTYSIDPFSQYEGLYVLRQNAERGKFVQVQTYIHLLPQPCLLLLALS